MIAILSRPIDTNAFVEKWQQEQQGPPVQFTFDGDQAKTIEIRNDSSGSTSWDLNSLRRTVEIAIHRVNPGCDVQWR